MGKITDRRERTAHTVIENKAVLAEGAKPKSEFPYRKLLIAVLVIVAIVACVFLVLNAYVDSYADKFATGESHEKAVATVQPTGDLYANSAEYLKNPEFSKAYLAAVQNHTTNASNIKSDPDIYNYVVAISSPQTDADTAGISVIMLLSLDDAKGKISYFAINKSMLVEIPTVGVGPIYDAYAYGSAALLTRTIQENFGVEIKGYVEMPLESFVQATLDLGGININYQKGTEDEQTLDTAAELYTYVQLAEQRGSDRNTAMTEVVKSLASKSADAGVMGLKGTVDTISDSLNANVGREDFGELITMIVGMFKNDPTVFQIGYDTSDGVTKIVHAEWIEPYAEFVTVNYAQEVAKLQSNIYGATK